MSESKRTIIRVREVMSTDFDLVDPMDTVDHVLRTARHAENKAFIVRKRHPDDEYGMALVSDIGRRVLARDRSPERVNIYEIMVKPMITVHPEMDIRYAARLFETFRLSRAPVVDHVGEVVGIISFTDLVLRGMMRDL